MYECMTVEYNGSNKFILYFIQYQTVMMIAIKVSKHCTLMNNVYKSRKSANYQKKAASTVGIEALSV